MWWSDDLLFMMGLVRYLVEGSCRDLVEGRGSDLVSSAPRHFPMENFQPQAVDRKEMENGNFHFPTENFPMD